LSGLAYLTTGQVKAKLMDDYIDLFMTQVNMQDALSVHESDLECEMPEYGLHLLRPFW
jgi:hypothetical protein